MVRDEDVLEGDVDPNDTQSGTREAENQYRWRIYRQWRFTFVYAEPFSTKPGRYHAAAVDQASARNACKQLARDERLRGKKIGPSKPTGKPINDPPQRPRTALAPVFRCGHPRTPENSYGPYGEHGQVFCKTCTKPKRLAAYYVREKHARRARRQSLAKGAKS